jgi:Domain of unknown function (DUF4136)
MLRLGLSLSLLLIGAPPVLAQKIKILDNPKADFSHYKTYEWLPGHVLTKHGIDSEGPYVTPALKAVVNSQMSQRGFQEVAKGGDIQINYWALTESDPQVEAIFWTNWIGPAGPMVSPGVIGVGGNPVVVGRYNHKGTVAINLIDPKTNTSLWAALAKDTVDTPDDVTKKVPKAMNKAFDKFPVKPAK